MNLVKLKKQEVRVVKDYPGLFTCRFDHKVSATTADMVWTGPTIPADEWRKVLAFFRWTHSTMQSESQVRMFVNAKLKTWAAWAFPQEARTGMTAHELVTEDSKAQRAAFADADGWLYLATVHHHCGAGAFQSGTDAANEENQDGLHITMGSLGQPHWDMHARFYLNGTGAQFDPDMAMFWDIGEVSGLIPPEVRDRVARWQMGVPPPADYEFPALWRENVIEVRRAAVTTYQGGLGYGQYEGWQSGMYGGLSDSSVTRAEAAVDSLLRECTKEDIHHRDIIEACNALEEQDEFSLILGTMKQFKVDLSDIMHEIQWRANNDDVATTRGLVRLSLESELPGEAGLVDSSTKAVDAASKAVDDLNEYYGGME